MSAVPTVPVFGSGVLPSTQLAQLASVCTFLLAPPIFRGRQTVIQSLTNAAASAITLDAEDVDTAGGHTTTSRYTAQYAGWYAIGGGIGYAANATGVRGVEWWVNGVPVSGAGCMFPANAATSQRLPGRAFLVYLNIGDYVEVFAFQNSGASLNTAVSGQEQASMSLAWTSN